MQNIDTFFQNLACSQGRELLSIALLMSFCLPSSIIMYIVVPEMLST